MFFLPLYDENPSKRPPIITWAFMFICFMVFIYQFNLPQRLEIGFVYKYAFIPDYLSNYYIVSNLAPINPLITLITSAFLHAGWMHILGNMLYLWIFGDNVEDSMGKFKFFIFYILCAISGSLLQYYSNPSSDIPIVGASGAIAGVLGSYLILYPKANIKVFMWVIIIFRTINIPAWIVLGIWILGQFFSLSSSPSSGGGVAYFAHIGGFIAGMALTPLLKNKDKPIFNDRVSSPWVVKKTQTSDISKTFTHGRKSSLPVFKKSKGSLPRFRR